MNSGLEKALEPAGAKHGRAGAGAQQTARRQGEVVGKGLGAGSRTARRQKKLCFRWFFHEIR